MERIEVSIIIPTLAEAENLSLLVPRIGAALLRRSYEIIVVDDDSRDGTPQVCAELAQQFPLRLIVRPHPRHGLSGAVLEGMAQARGETFVVMDADLQHPPEKIPELLAPIDSGEADFVIGSRYIPGGSTETRWGLLRRFNSRVATALARPFAGRVSDPMSGFFALKRSTCERAQRLTPLGYKIGLELMCKCRVKNVREIPIHFAMRQRGQSKLTLVQQFKYLEHLSRLYDFSFPRASPILKFLIATGCGWFVAVGLYLVLIAAKVHPPLAAACAYPLAILVTTIFHLRYVRTQREFLVRPHPWRDFTIISVLEWSVCCATAAWIAHRVPDPHAVEVFLISFGLATFVRYMLRKEFLQDIRGLRKEIRQEEML